MPKKEFTIEDMQKLAISKGGLCLSTVYKNTNSHLEWECSDGHIWNAIPSSIKQGHWCPKCNKNQRLTIEEMHKLATLKCGKCLSEEYINSQTPLKWECSQGHRWFASPNNIQSGKWCRLCSYEKSANAQRLTIEEINLFALSKEGKCLSNKYINAHTKYLWQCINGHIWEANYNSIQQECWCPRCTKNYTEEKCRWVFEQLFNKSFSKTRNLFQPYEIDGYCEELKLAFEYNGIQHYKHVPAFQKNGRSLDKQKKRDREVKKLCKKNGIKLLVIPYRYAKTDCYLEGYIRKYLCKMGFLIQSDDVSWIGFYEGLSVLKDLKILAEERNGMLLSVEYNGVNSDLKWQCSEGHIWKATPINVRRGTWCPECAGNIRKTIEDMQILAISKGGKYLSKKYVNSNSKLEWECLNGHTWEAIPSSITAGRWCIECQKGCRGYNKKSTIEEMHKIANSKNGECLSTIYTNAKTKLEWKCSHNHIWNATPDIINRGRWCTECNKLKRQSLRNKEFIKCQPTNLDRLQAVI